jgi:hypothetical protein
MTKTELVRIALPLLLWLTVVRTAICRRLGNRHVERFSGIRCGGYAVEPDIYDTAARPRFTFRIATEHSGDDYWWIHSEGKCRCGQGTRPVHGCFEPSAGRGMDDKDCERFQ